MISKDDWNEETGTDEWIPQGHPEWATQPRRMSDVLRDRLIGLWDEYVDGASDDGSHVSLDDFALYMAAHSYMHNGGSPVAAVSYDTVVDGATTLAPKLAESGVTILGVGKDRPGLDAVEFVTIYEALKAQKGVDERIDNIIEGLSFDFESAR
jgi:hypothetical protein